MRAYSCLSRLGDGALNTALACEFFCLLSPCLDFVVLREILSLLPVAVRLRALLSSRALVIALITLSL